jgi:U4/U6.U5 tri-snRNP-associated protein 2
VEKNPTLVTFPVKNLELKDYVDGEIPPGKSYGTKYNLVSNVTHQGKPDAGQYICHVLNRATDEW